MKNIFLLKKFFYFFERDIDITPYDEWHYIYITLGELFKIIIKNLFVYIKKY
jgi:hypothetical protein